MLDLDTIKQLDDLLAYTLYDAEVARLPRLSCLSLESQRALVERASQGDEEARHTLILHCLHFVLVKAHLIYRHYQPRHMDLLDLVAAANLEMVEKFDKALTANHPLAYLISEAIWKMQRYCVQYASMIKYPEYSLKALAKFHPHPARVESLDEPIYRDGKRLRVEVIEAPALSLEEAGADEEQEQDRFAPLYEALKELGPKQRATIISLYGLFGQPAETLEEIAQKSQITYKGAETNAYLARKRLRAVLASHLVGMLTPESEREAE